MDNYANDFTNRDKTTDIFCIDCGELLEELSIAFADTEYERDVELCENCLENKIGQRHEALIL